MVEFHKRHPNTKCTICGKDIYKRPSEIQKNKGRVFCSVICYGLSCRKEKPCIICGNSILAGANKKTCSRACSNKHRAGIKYKSNQSRSKVKSYMTLRIRLLKERGSTCERCGYNKYEILEVHHEDRNRQNNDLSTLELICPNCHAQEHFLSKYLITALQNQERCRERLSGES